MRDSAPLSATTGARRRLIICYVQHNDHGRQVMRLARVRVTNYRSINDTGYFDVDPEKTTLVGPNEAGKRAIPQALQHLEPPDGISSLDPLRDLSRTARTS